MERRHYISYTQRGKDKLDCGSFRTILVLNIDYKLYSAVLARRDEVVLPLLIHIDQTGFISQRQSCNNIRHYLHI